MEIFNADCLEKMKDLTDDSIDLIFCDLPYGQTSCKWDCKIDLEQFWKEVMRIKKTNTPIFFTTTTKFGVELIQSAPKKCPFRYDIVWLKSAPAGFLNSRRAPLRKHEMVYVFYEKLPFYDLSSHTHKFLKEVPKENLCQYDVNKNTYGGGKEGRIKISKNKEDHQQKYDPPLPTSIVKEEKTQISKSKEKDLYGDMKGGTIGNVHGTNYDPPLPTSIVKEEKKMMKIELNDTIYGDSLSINQPSNEDGTRNKYRGQFYDPPLPTTALEIKSTRGKHSTEKPVALMEWVLKYYSKEGDVVLDPTMGSGSTGIACKNMNRTFIGIEKDEEIFKVAEDRLK
jgi:DNA modification methylase